MKYYLALSFFEIIFTTFLQKEPQIDWTM